MTTHQQNTNQLLSDNISNDGSYKEGWHASLNLAFAPQGGRTVLRNRSQQGPLTVQRPFYPEKDVCHMYVLHPPGGVVGGDTMTIQCVVNPEARALITTPGATKFYRSDGRVAVQKQTLTVQNGGHLDWLPQENIFFPYANVRTNTTIYLGSQSTFMGWELQCMGRPALQEPFDKGLVFGKTTVFIDNALVLMENIHFQGDDALLHTVGMGGFPLLGTMIIAGGNNTAIDGVRRVIADNPVAARDGVVTVTQLDTILVVRGLGIWSETVLRIFGKIWQYMRYHWTGIPPPLPRIWAT